MSRNAWGFSFLLEGVSEGVSLKSERGVERECSSEELGDRYLCGRRVLALCASKVKLPLFVSLELPLCSPRLYILGIIPSALVSLSAWGYNTFLAMIQKASSHESRNLSRSTRKTNGQHK